MGIPIDPYVLNALSRAPSTALAPDLNSLIAQLPQTPDRTLRARFCLLAAQRQFVAPQEPIADLRRLLLKYARYPTFFSAMVHIFEHQVTQERYGSDFYRALTEATNPAKTIELLLATAESSSAKLFDAIWKQFYQDSRSWVVAEGQAYPSIADWLLRTRPFIESVLTRGPENLRYCAADVVLYQLVLTHSTEVSHDLALVGALSRPSGFSARTLHAYYQQGFKYICALEYFAPKRDGLTGTSGPELEVRAEFAKQQYYPAIKQQQRYVHLLARLDSRLRPLCVRLLARALKEKSSLRSIQQVIELLQAVSSTELPAAKEVLLRLLDPQLLQWRQALAVLEDVLRLRSVAIADVIQALDSSTVPELERRLYRGKLAEHQARYPEKPLEQMLAAYRTASHPEAVLVSEQQLQAACEIYTQIVRRGEQLRPLTRSALEQLAVKAAAVLREAASAEFVPIQDCVEFYALARELFKSHFGVYPYNTQIIAALLLDQVPTEARGTYAEVKTGEGKSLMLALLSAYKACCGHKVDVVTSNSYLAERDAARFAPFFASFALKVGSMPDLSRQVAETPIPAADCDILFATHHDLIFHYLRSRLSGQSFFAGDRFDVLLVDEADNLCLDLASESCRIAEPVGSILTESFYRAAIEFADQSSPQMLEHEVPRAVAEFQRRNPDYQSMHPVLLALQLRSAAHSRLLQRDVHYIVQHNRIIVVDHGNTERVRELMYWSEGLHECVALRNGLPLPRSMAQSAQMSHPSFIKRYRRLHCISGTFGDSVDRQELRELYAIEGFDVPTHHASRREDRPLKVCATQEQQLHEILALAAGRSDRASAQPLLILCSSIRESQLISAHLNDAGISHQLLNDSDNCDSQGASCSEQQIIDRAGQAGVITVATGVAGRGADIIPSPQSIAAGGLYALLTFVPANLRVEYQARGRAGRQGAPGVSAGIVALTEDAYLSSLSSLERESLRSLCQHFSGESPQVQRGLDFMRRANNLMASRLRLQRLTAEELLEQVFETHVQSLSSATSHLSWKNPLIARESGMAWFLVSALISEEWAQRFKEAESIVRFYELVAPCSVEAEATTPAHYLEKLQQLFQRAYGTTPEQFVRATSTEYETSVLALMFHYRKHLAWIEARLAQLKPETFAELLGALGDRMSGVVESCIEKLVSADEQALAGYWQSIQDKRLRLAQQAAQD
jgi:hypothetical protein